MRTRVLLADDHQLFRQGVRQILALTKDIEIVGEAGDGAEAERLSAELRPDVVLMDLNMPVVDGITATKHLADSQPDVKVVVLTMHQSDRHLFEALAAGAHGYVLKDSSADELIRTIREVRRGNSPLDPVLSSRVLREFRRMAGQQDGPQGEIPLTERELDILRLVAAGLSNKEIGAKLYLAEKTVKNYLTSIFQKLDITDRVQAAIYAHRHGLVVEEREP